MLQTIFKLQAHFKTAWLQTSHKCCWLAYSGDAQLKPRAVSPESQQPDTKSALVLKSTQEHKLLVYCLLNPVPHKL